MSWKEMRLLRDGNEPLVQVFVHGFSSVSHPEAYETLVEQILAARPAGQVYLFYWNSGTLWGATDFATFEDRAERFGKALLRSLNALEVPRRWPLHIVGHSLGARLVHYALAHHARDDRRINEVVLLAGAADAEDDDWPQCIDRVRGRVTNLYNPWDKALLVNILRSGRAMIGQRGIDWTHDKLDDHRVHYGHTDYWPNLETVLTDYWPAFVQYPAEEDGFDVECPFCGGEWKSLEPGTYVCTPEEDGCGLEFVVTDRGEAKQQPGAIECSTPGCGYIWEFTRFDPTIPRACPECHEELWRKGVTVVG